MLLTITTTYSPATDLGFLLYKNPGRSQSFELAFGNARVFYPEADADRCTAALLLEIDPIGLVRNRHGPSGEGFALEQYVNDRPYAASSFLSVAIAQVFGSALSGTSRDRPELAKVPIPLVAKTIVVTTPNVEYNVRFETLPAGRFRHKDHRFEWTRQEFRDCANADTTRFGYDVRFLPVGAEDPGVGPATQMAAFFL